jgi:hypothetical protein
VKINTTIILVAARVTELLVVLVGLSGPKTELDPEFKAVEPELTPVPVPVPVPIPVFIPVPVP